MQKNIGLFDRRGRVLLGIAFSLFFLRSDPWQWLGLLAPVMFATAYISWCPIYRGAWHRDEESRQQDLACPTIHKRTWATLRILIIHRMENPAGPQSCITIFKGQKAFTEGDRCKGFPIVLSGVISVRKLYPSGRSIALYRIAPGDSCLLSLSALLGESDVYSADAIAMEDTRIMMLSASAFDQRLVADMGFRRKVPSNFASRLLTLTALVEAMVEQGLDQRLAALLLRLGPVIETTHSELASELGTVREIVSRLLLRFKGAGWLELGRSRIEICDGGGLEQFVLGSA